MTPISVPTAQAIVDAGHLDDLKFAASKMLGAERRAFQAAMALKYGAGSARQAEGVFGWSRRAVERGRHEKRMGIICLSAHSAFAGDKLGEEKHPDVADALWVLAQSHSRQYPSFRSTLSFTRLTAAEALKLLRAQGFAEEGPPSASAMAEVLNRNGYRLRPVLKANDHDRGCKEQSTPFGGVNENSAELHLTFGRSVMTRDFVVDCLYSWWERPSPEQRDGLSLLQIKADNGPQSKGRRRLQRHPELPTWDILIKPACVGCDSSEIT